MPKTPEQWETLQSAGEAIEAIIKGCCGFKVPLPKEGTPMIVRAVHGICRKCWYRRRALRLLGLSDDWSPNARQLGRR
jgi:hypothetical protein